MSQQEAKDRVARYARACEAFDAAVTEAEAEISSGAWSEIEDSELIDRVIGLAEKLPQAPVIPVPRMAKWAATTLRVETIAARQEHVPPLENGDELPAESRLRVMSGVLWHIRRLSGIGGSECGDVVKHFRGERGDFSDGVSVVKEKLMFYAPRVGTEPMRRGHRIERKLRELYHETRGDVIGTDHEAMAAMRGFRSPRAPFLIGNPDDIVFVRAEGGRRRRISDYKAPSQDVFKEMVAEAALTGEIPFGYKSQLHLYGVVASLAGVAIHELELAPFDYARGVVGAIRPSGERMFTVPYDKALASEIHQACSRIIFEHVMTGVVPDPVAVPQIPVPVSETAELAFRVTLLKSVAKAADAEADQLRKDLEGVIADAAPGAVGKADFDHAALTIKRSWNEDELVASARAAGVDPEDHMTLGKHNVETLSDALHAALAALEAGAPEEAAAALREAVAGRRELDAESLASAVAEAGGQLIAAEEARTTYAMTRKSNGEGAVALAAIREFAANTVKTAEEEGIRARIRLMRGDALEDDLDDYDAA